MTLWDHRMMTIAGAFNVFFNGRALMDSPDAMLSRETIGWIVIAVLTLAIPMVLFPVQDRAPMRTAPKEKT